MIHKYVRVRLLVFALLLGLVRGAGATTPSCGCDELDPFSAAYQICTDSCTGSEIPVSGDAWVLVAAGLLLALASRKLVNQYKT